MTQKAVVKLTKTINDREYSFEMPIGAPYGEAYDQAFLVLQDITTMSKEAADRAKRPEKEEEIVEETEDN